MWKSTFYRKVDSDVESADGKLLRDIEEKIFRHQKAIIGQELKQKWKIHTKSSSTTGFPVKR